MKPLIILLLLFFYNFSFSQSIDFETEKNIIKETLSEYLTTNPNSLTSFLPEGRFHKRGHRLFEFQITTEKDSLKKEALKNEVINMNKFADSVSILLKSKKIRIQIKDTIFAFNYIPANTNLKNITDWGEKYKSLLTDFEKNSLFRFDTIIGKDYIDLIKKQIDYTGEDKPFQRQELNQSYYEFEKDNLPCDDILCTKMSKIYHAVFNNSNTKGCYLVSFYCGENEICKSFIFIKKEKNRWIYVDDYPTWLVDDIRDIKNK